MIKNFLSVTLFIFCAHLGAMTKSQALAVLQENQKLRNQVDTLHASTKYLLELQNNNGSFAKPQLGQESVLVPTTIVIDMSNTLRRLSTLATGLQVENKELKQFIVSYPDPQRVRGCWPQTRREYVMVMNTVILLAALRVMQDLLFQKDWCICW